MVNKNTYVQSCRQQHNIYCFSLVDEARKAALQSKYKWKTVGLLLILCLEGSQTSSWWVLCQCVPDTFTEEKPRLQTRVF